MKTASNINARSIWRVKSNQRMARYNNIGIFCVIAYSAKTGQRRRHIIIGENEAA